MRFATFNLKDFFTAQRAEHEAVVEEKLANVARSILESDADVLGLQEVGDHALFARLFGGPLAAAGYDHRVLAPGDRRGIRCAVASRHRFERSAVLAPGELEFPRFVASDGAPFPGRLPLRRPIPHVTVATPLGPVDVLVAHFKSKLGVPLRDDSGADVVETGARARAEAALRSLVSRAAEALFVRGVVDELLLADRSRAVVVMGDLNDTLDSLPVSIVCGSGDLALEAATRRVPEAERYTVLHRGEREQIDHILVSHALAPRLVRAVVLNGALRDHGPFVKDAVLPTPDSDHALFFVELA